MAWHSINRKHEHRLRPGGWGWVGLHSSDAAASGPCRPCPDGGYGVDGKEIGPAGAIAHAASVIKKSLAEKYWGLSWEPCYQ